MAAVAEAVAAAVAGSIAVSGAEPVAVAEPVPDEQVKGPMTMFETISDLSTITGGQAAARPAPRDDFGHVRGPVDLGKTVGTVVGGGPLRPVPGPRDPMPPILQLPGTGSDNWVR